MFRSVINRPRKTNNPTETQIKNPFPTNSPHRIRPIKQIKSEAETAYMKPMYFIVNGIRTRLTMNMKMTIKRALKNVSAVFLSFLFFNMAIVLYWSAMMYASRTAMPKNAVYRTTIFMPWE